MSVIDFTEKDFEKYIVKILTDKSGYTHREPDAYDKIKSLVPDAFISFIKTTQSASWTTLIDKYNTTEEAEEKLIDELISQRKRIGTLELLRKGFDFRTLHFDTVYWEPETNLNADTVALFKQNDLLVINQLVGQTIDNVTAIPDIVLFVNGIPVVTVELKFELQGQFYVDAEKQYKTRKTSEPIFSFKTGPLVHFAVDSSNASMTTKICGKATQFLPFNLGRNGAGNSGGKGNPPAPANQFPTDYLWNTVFKKESLLDILQSFITIDTDSKTKEDIVIFPRYHQLDVVRKLLNDVESNGSSKNYLIEHSAGSGKSNTIAWLAFHLNNLYFKNKSVKIFDTVIILNDRRVLDKQTRNTIMSFKPQEGTIVIAKKSSDIVKGIKQGNVIIISTIQKFPMIYRELEKWSLLNPDRRFAVIADEAHQSQSGNAAGKVKIGLGSDNESSAFYSSAFDEEKVAAEEEVSYHEEDDDVYDEDEATEEEQDKILKQIATGKQSNMSFFAFTATPTDLTLQMFGVPCQVKDRKSGKMKNGFRSFHVYSMQQAIEEKYILDVLVNYTTYKQYYNLRVKKTDDNTEYDSKVLTRQAKKYVSEHEHRISKISDIIINHFEKTGSNTIDGKGKAMIVTSSRREAVIYAKTLRAKLAERYHSNWGVLVAFSGDIDGKTESQMNSFPINPIEPLGKEIAESQTAEAFKQDKYRFIVVADKYQTGFSEKYLSVMYIDKKLHDIKAVQTLSRLNRTMPNDAKTAERDCFIIDFVNERETIKEAFQKYYGELILEGEFSVNDLLVLKKKIEEFNVIDSAEVDLFYDVLNQLVMNGSDLNHVSVAQQTVSMIPSLLLRYKKLEDNQQKDFRHLCYRFVKVFLFLQNIENISELSIVKLGLYLKTFIPLFRMMAKNPQYKKPEDIRKLIELSDYRIDDEITASIHLLEDSDAIVKHVDDGGSKEPPKPAPTTIQELVGRINSQFGTDFTDEDIVPAISAFKKQFGSEKQFCNASLIQQYPKYELKYNGNEGDTVFVQALESKEITDKVRKVLYSNIEFFKAFKDEIRMPVYEHLQHKLHIS